jgi:hypothetical protein
VAVKTYPVAGPDLLEPFWFNRVRHGQHAAVVGPDRTITLEGVPLSLRAEAPEPGTPVQVWLNGSGFFVCATLAEIEREAQARRDAEAAEAARQRQRLNELRAEAEAFNGRIALPVQWDVGIKDVLSGLTESSWGDGRNKATVEHIYLLEPLQAGRLTRAKGDFLCTSGSGTNGRRYSSVIERGHDGEGNTYRPKVTCRACLALAARWMKEAT